MIKLIGNLNVFHVKDPTYLSNERVTSVDALRGFDMFWIMGGEGIFMGLDKVFHNKITGFINEQLNHVEWFGFHFYDIIMPLFLFLVGISMVYSFRKRLSTEKSDIPLWKHTIKRVVILWLLGMIVQGNLLTYDLNKFHFYANTLQAIAAGYLIAAVIILYLPVIHQLSATLGLMLLYWAIMALIPIGGNTLGAYTPDRNVAQFVDAAILGRFDDGLDYTWIVSSINFGATTMLGVFCGYILQSGVSKLIKFRNFIIFGAILIVLALILDCWHPIIKKLWTSSFVLFSGGFCVLLLGVFYLIIDIWNVRKGTKWMIIIGSNAIFAYVVSHVFGDQLRAMADVFINGLKPFIGNWFDTFTYAGGVLILIAALNYMYKNKIYIKI
jgi:predicted acyltransferase